MKKILSLSLIALFAISLNASAQKAPEDKSKRPSQPAVATGMAGSAAITINYSTPSVKGRTIGKDLEPKAGQVWRTGANEATTFEVNKDVMINGSKLPAGKYGFFTLYDGTSCTLIFNKTWDQWGAFDYKMADDVLRVPTTVGTASPTAEKFNISIDGTGKVTLVWGATSVSFDVKPV